MHKIAVAMQLLIGENPAFAKSNNHELGLDMRTHLYKMRTRLLATAIALSLPSAALAQCIVDWNTVYQRIDGFGASCAYSGRVWSTATADAFFSTNAGIGLSLLRSQVQPGGTQTSSEIGLMQLAQARGARNWSTPWVPASTFTSGGSYQGYGSDATNLVYAQQLANYCASMQSTYGVSIYALSIQNEPDNPGFCLWNPRQIHDFTTNLYNAFQSSNVTALIMLPESQNWTDPSELENNALNDTNSAADVGIVANHDYVNNNTNGDQTTPAVNPYATTKPVWETEVSTIGDTPNGSITNAMYWAVRIHLFLTVAQVNAWHYWWLISGNADNEGLQLNGNIPTMRMYVVGNYSRFIRPGYYRIGATNTTSALISAYQETNSGTFVIVAINTNASTAISQTFTLTNCTIVSPTVTPWMTCSNQSTFAISTNSQAPVAVSGSSFSYTLPAMSVVTFVGQAVTNTPVTLAPVANQVVNAGVTLLVTNSATDSGVPPVTLSFSLLSGPTNATLTSLDATDELLTYRPLVSQANTTNQFAVMVAVNGNSSLNATNSFTVTVNPLASQPALSSISILGGQISLGVNGPVGPDYTLLTTTNLTGGWQALYKTNSPVTPLTLVDTNPAGPARFYRIQIGP
jgi:glucuronoarabinoxylan endo-1,4-beta-xylanase